MPLLLLPLVVVAAVVVVDALSTPSPRSFLSPTFNPSPLPLFPPLPPLLLPSLLNAPCVGSLGLLGLLGVLVASTLTTDTKVCCSCLYLIGW